MRYILGDESNTKKKHAGLSRVYKHFIRYIVFCRRLLIQNWTWFLFGLVCTCTLCIPLYLVPFNVYTHLAVCELSAGLELQSHLYRGSARFNNRIQFFIFKNEMYVFSFNEVTCFFFSHSFMVKIKSSKRLRMMVERIVD